MSDNNDVIWMLSGASCLMGGAAVALVSRRPFWFAAGAIVGAGIVAYRVFDHKINKNNMIDIVPQALPAVVQELETFTAHPEWRDQLGAPQISIEGQSPISATGLPVRLDDLRGNGYPMMHRIPDVEIHLNTMDDFIKPHFTGELGPEIDSWRNWGGGGSGIANRSGVAV